MAALKIILILTLYWIAAVKAGVEEDALLTHNRLRSLHGSPPLTLSADLNSQAAEYAKVLADKGTLEHSKSEGKYGENLCFRSHNPEKCSQDWYDEIKDYDFDNPSFSMNTGHFTALVWASSTEMGYGQAQAKNGYYYVVAMYVPAGNVVGRFDKEVPKPKHGGGGRGGRGGPTTQSKSSKITLSIKVMIVSICFGLFKLTN